MCPCVRMFGACVFSPPPRTFDEDASLGVLVPSATINEGLWTTFLGIIKWPFLKIYLL